MAERLAEPPIALLLVTNTLARGGAEAMLAQLALALDPAVVQPVVVCLDDPGPGREALEARSVPVYSRLLRHKFDARVVGRLCRLIERHGPACVMAVGNGGDRMFWSTVAAWRTGVPVVVWSHIFPRPGSRTFEWVNRRLYRRVDAFVALGQRHREALIELERIPPDRVRVIRNGIDASRFDVQTAGVQGRPAPFLRRGDEVTVGIIANLRSDKRHDIFVDAAVRVHRVRSQTRFVIVGDGPERRRVEAMVSAADPAGRFLSMLGECDHVEELLQELDIVCLTSDWHECLSVAMLEGMAAGKAFVSSKIGSLDEALIDRVTGRFFEPLSPDALAEVLVELIDDPGQRADLGRRASEKVRAEFTVQRMAREFERLIAELCRAAAAS